MLRWNSSSWQILPICSGVWSWVWVCVWASACVCSCCCSWRLWLSTEMPLSLWSFSPSGDGDVWLAVAARLLAACLFCLQLFHLGYTQSHKQKEKGKIILKYIVLSVSSPLYVVFLTVFGNTSLSTIYYVYAKVHVYMCIIFILLLMSC